MASTYAKEIATKNTKKHEETSVTINVTEGSGVQLFTSQEQLRQQVKLGIEQADRGELVDHDRVFSHLRSIARRH